MQKIKCAICIINYKKTKSTELAKQTVSFLQARGVEFLCPQHDDVAKLGYSAHELNLLEEDLRCYLAEIPQKKPDIAFIFGGDGTLIHASRVLALYHIPIIGVNLGKLGFLTAVEPNNLESSLVKLMEGNYLLEDRMLLWGEVRRNDKVVMSSIAQNDVIINHGSISRIIDINVLIDHQLALSFSGDGLVLATPTGSTAYSLSAGGPIVLPNAQMIVVTPISPHNLYARPMIANADSEIQVICNFLNKKAQVTFDGQNLFLLQHGDEVIIKKSPYSACFVWIESSMFFTNLHRKLCSGI